MLVLVDLVASALVAANAPAPAAVPDYALRAAAVYRLEVGGACFVVVYLMAIAFFLALDGRGFVELGTKGLKVERIVGEADDEQVMTVDEHLMSIRNTRKTLKRFEAALDNVIEDQAAQGKRLRDLEERGSDHERARS